MSEPTRYDPVKVNAAIDERLADAARHQAWAERLMELSDDERREQYRYESQARTLRKMLEDQEAANDPA